MRTSDRDLRAYVAGEFGKLVGNSAFVNAVEGRDAADVIGRGAELIDATGENSALSTARAAQESERIVSRMQPAIIRGERRMLRIVNVPLSTGAVAGFAIDVQDLEDAQTELARNIESQRELADRMTAGTAQKIENGQYVRKYYSSFIGYLPAKDPEISILVSLDNPSGGSYYGGTVSGPAFREVASKVAEYLGIPPQFAVTNETRVARL